MSVLFWTIAVVLTYTYVGYPTLLFILRALGLRYERRRDQKYEPTVSMIVAAHNEENVIANKLRNFFDLEYPPTKMECLIVSDGSIDRTDKIAKEFIENEVLAECGRVQLLRTERRLGKANALNVGVKAAKGDILIFSDANVIYEKDVAWKLVSVFTDSSVGGVTGDVQLQSRRQESFGAGETLYYKYERFLQQLESDTGGVVGVDGAMYAIRRSAFRELPPDTLVDDLVLSMEIASKGQGIVYDPRIVGHEDSAPTTKVEFWRKTRIIEGGFNALRKRQGLPGLKTPILLWKLVSHKVLRWLLAVWLILLFVASGTLAIRTPISGLDGYVYAACFFGMISVFGFAFVNYLVREKLSCFKLVQISYYFAVASLAACVGLVRAILFKSKGTWERTSRNSSEVDVD